MLGQLLQAQEAVLVELEEPALVELDLELLSSKCRWLSTYMAGTASSESRALCWIEGLTPCNRGSDKSGRKSGFVQSRKGNRVLAARDDPQNKRPKGMNPHVTAAV